MLLLEQPQDEEEWRSPAPGGQVALGVQQSQQAPVLQTRGLRGPRGHGQELPLPIQQYKEQLEK